eukprot:c18234_g1_i2.p1 GENE.c18234_g1_i2~~c18234_g1_i2.p1  ORF type:complete len:247 (+),score=61.06 c18234_g1_i2:132-872(+)
MEVSNDAEVLRGQLDAVRATAAKEALNIINVVFPQKILQLSRMFEENSLFKLTDSDVPAAPLPDGAAAMATHNASGSKKRKRDDDNDVSAGESFPPAQAIPANAHLTSMLGIVKKELVLQISYCNSVKVWVQLQVPRIEDGNDFGVSIQQETVGELARAEESCLGALESVTKFYLTRARLITKLVKYPLIEDYAMSIKELDEKELINARLIALDLRNSYHTLYDHVTKNMEKIEKPRSSDSMATMY